MTTQAFLGKAKHAGIVFSRLPDRELRIDAFINGICDYSKEHAETMPIGVRSVDAVSVDAVKQLSFRCLNTPQGRTGAACRWLFDKRVEHLAKCTGVDRFLQIAAHHVQTGNHRQIRMRGYEDDRR